MEDRCQPALASALVKPREDALDRSSKARNPDFYSGNMYIKWYYFCQQYKGYFKIAAVKDHKRVPFATISLEDHIVNHW